jgi:hypothetical protein
MLETHIAQLVASMPNPNVGMLLGQPKPTPKGSLNGVTTRGGRST